MEQFVKDQALQEEKSPSSGRPPEAVPEEKRDDSDGLGARRLGPMVMGLVDEVNGLGSAPCPDYVPTRHEALLLARYWSDKVLDHDTDFFYTQTVGSDDWRILAYAIRRLDRIAETLGTEPVQAVYDEVEARYRKKMGEEVWNLYKHGSKEEQERFCAELWSEPGNPTTYSVVRIEETAGEAEGAAAESETAMPAAEAEHDFFGTLKRMRDAKAKRQA